MIAKFISFVKAYHADIVLVIVMVSVTIISFNLGRMSLQEKGNRAISVIGPTDMPGTILSQPNTGEENKPKNQTVVASKASTSKLYHFSWCSGAKRISEKNKLTFPNEAAAIAAGYSLAGNCQR